MSSLTAALAVSIPRSDLHGEIVTWDTEGAKPVDVSVVRGALASAGLSEDEAGDLQARSGFSRACKDLKEGRLIRKVETNGRRITFQLTGEAVRQGKLDYQYECQIILDADSGQIECPESAAVETLARQLFAAALEERTSRDITAIVQRLFKKNAELYPINPRKGVAYFVPSAHFAFSDQVEAFLKSLGGTLGRFPVPKGSHGDASVQTALKKGFAERLAELQKAIDGWTDTTRPGTMKKMEEKFVTEEFKISAYRDLLQDQAAALDEAIAAGKKAVADRLFAANADEV